MPRPWGVGEDVAAKFLRAEHVSDQELVGRFVTERTVLNELHHPGVVRIRDLVTEQGRIAIVMDYVDGGSLRQLLTGGPLPAAEATRIVGDVLESLAVVHEKGILHRDVKPDNVLLTADWRMRSTGGIKLTDFGVARLASERTRLSNGFVGTPEYMAPEVFSGGEVGAAADVYGAGILLYELLAGRTPYGGSGNDYTIAHRHVVAAPPALPVSAELWAVLTSMIDKSPALRPTAARAASTLKGLGSSLVEVEALPAATRPIEFEVAPNQTILRGSQAALEPELPRATTNDPGPELGTSSQQTMFRARPEAGFVPAAPVKPPEATGKGRARKWRLWTLTSLGALMVAAGVIWLVLLTGRGSEPGPSETSVTLVAQQQDQVTPTGLTIARRAEFDPRTGRVRLTITYSAQNAPLRGPFLEVLPGLQPGDECPVPVWQGNAQKRNLPTVTGITTPCAWSVDVGEVPRQGTQTVTVEVPLPKVASDPAAGLQPWLDGAAALTASTLADPDVTGAAFPVQRLRDVRLIVPDRIESAETLPISLLPVWPSGVDTLNPLYRSPAVGELSSLLIAVAGAENPVRFSDGCSGGVMVSGDGLVVTTLTVATSCRVNAQVGNFPMLVSNDFATTTREN